jgi:hypothetical protein
MLWLQTRCLEPVLMPKRKLGICTTDVANESLSSLHNVTFG